MRAGELPSLETMRHVELKLDVTPFRGDGGREVKVEVAGGEGMGVANHPMHPGGNFPLECAPHLSKMVRKGKVTETGFDEPVPTMTSKTG